MYRECFVDSSTVDSGLALLIVVLVLIVLGLICAVERQRQAARKYRELFQDSAETSRRLRRELRTLQFERAFPKGSEQ